MILLDRYLRTLHLFLPQGQRDDIIRELSEEIETDVAEQERALRRSLTLDEEAAVIDKYGHPLLAAARYQSQRYLIGPLMFPYYWLLLRVVLALVIAGHMIGGSVLLANGADWAEIGALGARFVQTSLKVLGWLTLLAAMADLWLTRSGVLERWNPRTLIFRQRAQAVQSPVRSRIVPPVRMTTRGTAPSVSGFVILATLSTWWLLALKFPTLLFLGGADIVAWGPAMNRLYPLLATSLITELVQQVARLWPPHLDKVSRITRPILGLASVALLVLMMTSDHQWVVWSEATKPDMRIVNLVNHAFSAAFMVAALVGTASALWGMSRWFVNPKRVVAVGVCFGAVVPVLAVHAQDMTPSSLPTEAAIREMLVERVDVKRQSVGMVVGIVTPTERRVVAYGRLAHGDARVMDGNTIFEIGSVTKIFTAILLAESARRGEVSIDDAAAAYLPPAAKMIVSKGRPITLVDLATHTSGLPFWPSNIPPTAEGVRLMASYTVDQLYQYLSTFEVPADVGSQWAYSNMDAGLLGLVLARRAHTSYEGLLEARVTGPLRMTSTAVAVLPAMQTRLAVGHNKALAVAPPWNVPTLMGAGSVHSTVNDLLTLLSAALGHVESPLAPAFRATLTTQRKGPAFQQALGWWIFQNGETQVITHVGGTLGFASQVAYDPKTKIGVVVLSNSVNPISDLTTHLLIGSSSTPGASSR